MLLLKPLLPKTFCPSCRNGARPAIVPEKSDFAELGQNENTSSDWLEAAQTLVNQYGMVLERHGEPISSDELLPASKQDIKLALITVARAARSAGQLSPDVLEQFCVGYASLANFVAPAEADVARHFFSVVKSGAGIADPNDQRLLEVAEALKDSRAIEIQRRSNEEFARLAKEFDAALGRGVDDAN